MGEDLYFELRNGQNTNPNRRKMTLKTGCVNFMHPLKGSHEPVRDQKSKTLPYLVSPQEGKFPWRTYLIKGEARRHPNGS